MGRRERTKLENCTSSLTFSKQPVGQRERLHLQRDELDPQLRRHQKQIFGFAREAFTILCCEQLVMVQQT